MSHRFELAQLVRRKGDPTSYGHVSSLDPFEVTWSLNGYVAPKWGQGRYSEPERCSPDDLEETYCPGCGEDSCWCGVGR